MARDGKHSYVSQLDMVRSNFEDSCVVRQLDLVTSNFDDSVFSTARRGYALNRRCIFIDSSTWLRPASMIHLFGQLDVVTSNFGDSHSSRFKYNGNPTQDEGQPARRERTALLAAWRCAKF